MKLNRKQIDIIIDKLFEPFDTDWMEMTFDELRTSDVEIEPSASIPGWWQMRVYGCNFTELNFKTYPNVLELIKQARDKI